MQQIISIGDRVEMEMLVRGQLETDNDKKRVLPCRIMDMPGYNMVRITMPFFEGRIVPLAVGDQYMMNIFAHKGIYGGRFVVVNRLKDGNLFLADMELQEKLKKVQRREYFRHDCRIPAQYRMISLLEADKISEEDLSKSDNVLENETENALGWKKCVILDISGGGVRMVSEFHEDKEYLVQLKFPMASDGVVDDTILIGKLLSSTQNKNSKNLYEQRLEFNHIDDKQREKIIRFIFDEERKKISKEKGL